MGCFGIKLFGRREINKASATAQATPAPRPRLAEKAAEKNKHDSVHTIPDQAQGNEDVKKIADDDEVDSKDSGSDKAAGETKRRSCGSITLLPVILRSQPLRMSEESERQGADTRSLADSIDSLPSLVTDGQQRKRADTGATAESLDSPLTPDSAKFDEKAQYVPKALQRQETLPEIKLRKATEAREKAEKERDPEVDFFQMC